MPTTTSVQGERAEVKTSSHRSHQRSLMWARIGFIAPALIYLAAFFVYPIIYNIRMSLTDYTTTTFYTGEAPFVGLGNFVTVFQDDVLMTTFRNTAVFTGVSLIAQFTLGMLLALFFRNNFPGNGVLRSMLLLPWLLPAIVSGTVWKWMLSQDSGIVNSMLRSLGIVNSPIPWLTDGEWAMVSIIIANVWSGIPFCMVLLHSGMRGIPGELYESASLDGASAWQKFWNITWPLLRPVSAVVLTLSLIYTLKTFDIIWILTGGGPANATQTLATFSYVKSFREFQFGQGAAVGDILVLISLIFGLVYLHSYRKSVREGAGK